MPHIRVEHTFPQPPAQVFAYLSEHENLQPLLKPIKVSRRNDGDTDRNGVGSARDMRLGPTSFVETITEVVPNQRIAYTITQGGPMKQHAGLMTFTPDGDGTRLVYTIDFQTKLPGLGAILKPALANGLRKGLRNVEPKI